MTFVGEPKFSISSYSVILVHLEIHKVLYAGPLLHVQDGYSQCWKVRVSLRHVGRHSTR